MLFFSFSFRPDVIPPPIERAVKEPFVLCVAKMEFRISVLVTVSCFCTILPNKCKLFSFVSELYTPQLRLVYFSGRFFQAERTSYFLSDSQWGDYGSLLLERKNGMQIV